MAATYSVSHSAAIRAAAADVYRILADYLDGHPRILPRPFRNFVVEAGGRGQGTLTRFDVRAFGRTQSFRHEVLEPAPGRVLVERDRDTGTSTTFTVEPSAAGHSVVTILTELPSRPGLAGALERVVTRGFLRRLYREELSNLAEVAGGSERVEYTDRERAALIAVAAIGLLGLNGTFVWAVIFRGDLVREAARNPVSLALMAEAFLMTGLLAYLLRRWRATSIGSGWFVVLALAGGLGFALPVALLRPRGPAPTRRI